MIIYLGPVSPPASCGLAAESSEQLALRHDSARLAANGVYLPYRSPGSAERSYRSRFTLTGPHGPAVSFLWHFPYGHPRLPLATVLLYAVRTFLTTFRPRDHLLV